MEFQCRVIVQRRCTSCYSPVENIPLQAERHSGRRQKLFALPPESAFTFRPVCCSESQRNSVPLQTGIAFTFDRIPHFRGGDPTKGIASICVPPKSANDKPFLVIQGEIASQVRGHLFAYFERVGDAALVHCRSRAPLRDPGYRRRGKKFLTPGPPATLCIKFGFRNKIALDSPFSTLPEKPASPLTRPTSSSG
jgi:hypothetical protein